MRKLAYLDISNAMCEAMAYSIDSTIKKGAYLPRQTVEAYNQYLHILGKTKLGLRRKT